MGDVVPAPGHAAATLALPLGQALLVPEYWLFDPEGGVLPAGQPRLQGRRLCHGEYAPIQPWIEGGRRLLRSEALGLDVRAEGKLLRFRDPVTGKDLLHQDEEKARADREASARHAESVSRRPRSCGTSGGGGTRRPRSCGPHRRDAPCQRGAGESRGT